MTGGTLCRLGGEVAGVGHFLPLFARLGVNRGRGAFLADCARSQRWLLCPCRKNSQPIHAVPSHGARRTQRHSAQRAHPPAG